MLYSNKNTIDLEKVEEEAPLQNQVKQKLLQGK